MFANFFGIVIISASALLIAGLVLRSDPNLPATMNLGIVDKLTDSTMQAASTDAAGGTSNNASASSSDSGSSGTDASASSTNAAANDNSASDTAAADENSASDTANSSGTVDTTTRAVAQSSPDSKPAAAAGSTQGFSKAYLESKRRALEEVGSAPTRTNKSDSDKYNK